MNHAKRFKTYVTVGGIISIIGLIVAGQLLGAGGMFLLCGLALMLIK